MTRCPWKSSEERVKFSTWCTRDIVLELGCCTLDKMADGAGEAASGTMFSIERAEFDRLQV